MYEAVIESFSEEDSCFFSYLPLKALEHDGLMFITERCLFCSRIGVVGMIVLHGVKLKKFKTYEIVPRSCVLVLG